MPVYFLPKSPKSMPMSMSMPMPVYASASTIPIFDLNRAAGPVNTPDNPFFIHDRPGSPGSGPSPRLPEIGQYGEADLSLGLHRLGIDGTYSPNRNRAGSPRPVLEHEGSASFEATQSLIQSLAQMRALGRCRMPQAAVAGPSNPPAGLVARGPALPIPVFEIAPTIPLPASPRTGSARTTYRLRDEEGASDDASAVVTEVNNIPSDDEGAFVSQARPSYLSPSNSDALPGNDEYSFDQAHNLGYPRPFGEDSFLSNYNDEGDSYVFTHESPALRAVPLRTFLGSPLSSPAPVRLSNREPLTPRPILYHWVGVPDSDDGSVVVGHRTGQPEISPFGPAINGYSPAEGTDRSTPMRVLLYPPMADEEADRVFNFPSGTPTPAPRGEGAAGASAASSTDILASISSPTPEPSIQAPFQRQEEPTVGTIGWPIFKSWRTGRLPIIPEDGDQAVPEVNEESTTVPSSEPQTSAHLTSSDDRSPLGERSDGEQESSALSSPASAYSLCHIPSHLPLSIDNSNESAHSFVNTLPPLRTPSPDHPTDPEEQALPSIQTLGLPTLNRLESAEGEVLAIRETAEPSSSSAIVLRSSTPDPWDETEEEKRIYQSSVEAARYEADNESEDE